MVLITLNPCQTLWTIVKNMRSIKSSIHDVMGKTNDFNFSYIGKGIVWHTTVGKTPPMSLHPKRLKSTIDKKGLLYEW
jgi:hypothetical protein